MKHIRNPNPKIYCVACCVVSIEDGDQSEVEARHQQLLKLEQGCHPTKSDPGLTAVRAYFRAKNMESHFCPDATVGRICCLLNEHKQVVVETQGSSLQKFHAMVVEDIRGDDVVVMDPDFEQPERHIPKTDFDQLRRNNGGALMNSCWVRF